MRTWIILMVIVLFGSAAHAQMDTVISRYKEYLLRTHEPQQALINRWITSFNDNNQWPDINYEDKELSAWKITWHLQRVRDMALAWSDEGSAYYHDDFLEKIISDGLDHWLEKRYWNTNWWHNQIGVPQFMRDIIILYGDQLTAAQRKGALEVMAQLRVQDNGVGANLMWSADLGLHYGALTNDEELVGHCRKLILKEIRIHTGEGIQPDYSFHQHGKRLQMFQYGKAFLWESIRLAWQLRETALAFPEDEIKILTDFILEGWQWMARGVNTVPGTMDRSASRVGELKSPDLRPLMPFMKELQPRLLPVFQTMEDHQNGNGSLTGHRYYPYSDFAVYHQPDFSFFLKTISSRTLPTESINSENLKGKLLNSGDAYLIRDGQEYYNLMPVWDWNKLPGVTSFEAADHISRKDFVGSVSNGAYGFTVMDYQLRNKQRTQILSTHKFWACYNGVVIALFSDMADNTVTGNIYTALDQSRWRGDVTVNGRVIDGGSHRIEGVKWIHHAGLAYIPLQPAPFNIQLKEVSGTWKSINDGLSPDTVREKTFMPVMLHEDPFGPSGYAMTVCKSPGAAKRLAKNPNWKVLRNDKDCQAIVFKDGTVMAAFFSPGQLDVEGDMLEVDRSCLLMIPGDKIYVSDPTHKGGQVNIGWKGKYWNVQMKKDGFTKEM